MSTTIGSRQERCQHIVSKMAGRGRMPPSGAVILSASAARRYCVPRGGNYLWAREPLVVKRLVATILVHLEQGFVDALSQRAAIGDGDAILLWRENGADDSKEAVSALRGQILKSRRVEDESLDFSLGHQIASLFGVRHVDVDQALFGQVVGCD